MEPSERKWGLEVTWGTQSHFHRSFSSGSHEVGSLVHRTLPTLKLCLSTDSQSQEQRGSEAQLSSTPFG